MKAFVRPMPLLALACALLVFLLPAPVPAEGTEPVDYAVSIQPDPSSDTLKTQVSIGNFIDGDTTHFLASSADFPDGGYFSGRFLAVNTPECTGKIEEYGKKAAAFTKERLENAEKILAESDDGHWNRDSNGTRYLVWVWYLPKGETSYRCLNVELLQNGLAKPHSAGQTRYGDVCTAAVAQARALGLNLWSGQKDPDYWYGNALEVTLRELRLHPGEYDGKKVACSGVITMNSNNCVYMEAYDPETGLYYGLPVYYGYNLSGGGMEILHVGNEVRVVGTLQYYEAGEAWQISGISYRMMKPDDPGNIQKISEGNEPACTPVSIRELTHGSVPVSTDDMQGEAARGEIALACSVSLDNVTVAASYGYDGGTTLICAAEGDSITVRTSDEGPTARELTGKTVSVRGVVFRTEGEYWIKAFTPDGIAAREP